MWFLDPRRALGRTMIGLLVGLVVGGVLFGIKLSIAVAALSAWNATGLTMLVLAWRSIVTCDEHTTAKRAAAEDPGRTAVYALVVAASAASLLSANLLVRRAHELGAGETGLLLALCLVTVALSWALTNTAFTLRYAHLYYREDAEGVGGLVFPGEANPDYADFAYLAFTIGMCFQVSDTSITSRQIRSTVLLHATLSFFYNTAILAFVLNLTFGHAS